MKKLSLAAALVAFACAGCQKIEDVTPVAQDEEPAPVVALTRPPLPAPDLPPAAAASPSATPNRATATVAPIPIAATEKDAAGVVTAAPSAAMPVPPIDPAPPARPAPVAAAKPTPFAGFGDKSNGLSAQPKAYNQRRAFVDTDGDGRKFDTRQPSRTRTTPLPAR